MGLARIRRLCELFKIFLVLFLSPLATRVFKVLDILLDCVSFISQTTKIWFLEMDFHFFFLYRFGEDYWNVFLVELFLFCFFLKIIKSEWFSSVFFLLFFGLGRDSQMTSLFLFSEDKHFKFYWNFLLLSHVFAFFSSNFSHDITYESNPQW